jgi:hypothetical protein
MQQSCDYFLSLETGFVFPALSYGEVGPHCYTGGEQPLYVFIARLVNARDR